MKTLIVGALLLGPIVVFAFAAVYGAKLLHYLRQKYPGAITVDQRGLRTAFVTMLVAGVVVLGLAYFLSPHPRTRQVVQFKSESIVTVDGVTHLGWLTDCSSGERRHITGDFKVVQDTTPVVCSTESHYDEWLKEEAQQAQAR